MGVLVATTTAAALMAGPPSVSTFPPSILEAWVLV